jgi:hypothetical protein
MREAWEIKWAHSALWALRQLHWRDATKVDAAVVRFAETGEGRLERVARAPTGRWLIVPPFFVRLSLDPSSRSVVVWWIMRRRPGE